MAVTEAPTIRGFGEPSPEDFKRLNWQLERERDWYGDSPAYQTYADVNQAIESGALVTVHDNHHIRLIRRFAEQPERFVAATNAASRAIIYAFGNHWQLEADALGVAVGNIRLAVTSLVRPAQQQAAIIERGALAVPDSTHTKGGASDFDGAGYYRFDDDAWVSVGHPGREAQQQATLQQLLEADPESPIQPRYAYDYDERVMRAAWAAAYAMHDRGIINLVPEFDGTPNAVLHIAADPEFQ